MNNAQELLRIADGGRLGGREHFYLQNAGLLDRAGGLTKAGKQLIAPLLEARKASAAKLDAQRKDEAAKKASKKSGKKE